MSNSLHTSNGFQQDHSQNAMATSQIGKAFNNTGQSFNTNPASLKGKLMNLEVINNKLFNLT